MSSSNPSRILSLSTHDPAASLVQEKTLALLSRYPNLAQIKFLLQSPKGDVVKAILDLLPSWDLNLSLPDKVVITRADVMVTVSQGEENDDSDNIFKEEKLPSLSNLLTITFIGNASVVKTVSSTLKEQFPPPNTVVEWLWSTHGDSVEVCPPKPHKTSPLLYPYLPEGLSTYCDKFLASNSSVLLLIGPPGTGKSTFLKYLLHEKRQTAKITYSDQILRSDYTFMSFLTGSRDLFIIEDADDFIRARDDSVENNLVHKFLSMGDGIVSIPNKKLIFSTNLTGLHHVDPALIRKGRCFGVIQTRALTWEECLPVIEEYSLPAPTEEKPYTLAELFNQEEVDREVKKKTVGFLS